VVYRRTARSEEIRATTRKRLLDEAWKLFSERGYNATTMQEIVRKAGTSIGNAYFYFENKEALLVELLGSRTRAIWDRTEAALAGVPAGPARFATTIFLNVAQALKPDVPRLLFTTDQAYGSLSVVRDVAVVRWSASLSENFPGVPAKERELAVLAIWGVNRTILETLGGGSPAPSPREIARFLARWALRGLGVKEEEITSALRIASRKADAN
jgi:AcrR family transcriptional regulator